ncbi:MAG TPA: glucuronate isomerase [Chryseosolibacter sp.]
METFITEDFLLQNEFSKRLYHGFAKDLPIIDYHCHLSPKDIATDRKFRTISEIWLEGDHYKWRAMRTLGVNEKFITGAGSDLEKFQQWAYTVPHTMRNPLYHWTHLELQRYFGIKNLLDESSALTIYTTANDLLQTPPYTTRSLLQKMKVEFVGTTDDPTDSLEFHRQLKDQNFGVAVRPSFRPDKSFAVEIPAAYVQYMKLLSSVSGVEIKTFGDLILALTKRIDFFHSLGCRVSDHGLEQLYHPGMNTFKIEELFKKVIAGKILEQDERAFFKYSVLIELCKLYHKHGWVQQFHLGALRNTNERMLQKLGPDTGFDSIGDFPQAHSLARFMNELDRSNQLAKTILYNLNPSDNEVMGTMIGNFNDGSVKGKIQFGSAWWFLDQKDGMEKQINSLSNLGLLSCFIGMITDSRSFLSYPRHEYFRRILCNLIGKDVTNGELPWDEKWLGKIVADVCYYNAKGYFGA